MSLPTAQERIHALAELAGEPAPDLDGQPELGIAVAEVHLTNQARSNGATWAQIAKIHGRADHKQVKAYLHKLEAAVRQELTLRQNAN